MVRALPARQLKYFAYNLVRRQVLVHALETLSWVRAAALSIRDASCPLGAPGVPQDSRPIVRVRARQKGGGLAACQAWPAV